jgi:acetyl esterase/lipase
MKPFLTKVRHRVAFAFLLAPILCAAMAVSADDLEDAVKASEARATPPLLSREIMLRRQQVREVHLSPDASLLSYIIAKGRIRQLWLYSVKDGSHRMLFSSKLMNDLAWSKDSRYLFIESEQGVSAVSVGEGAGPAFIINLEPNDEQYAYGLDDTHPHAYLVSLRSEDRSSHSIYRVLPDGEQVELYKSGRRTVDLLLNESGDVSFIKRVKGNAFELLKLDGEHERFLFRCEKHDPCSLRSFDQASGDLYVIANFEGDLSSLYKINVETGERALVHRDPIGRHDLRHLIINPKTHLPLLAGYQDDHFSQYGITAKAKAALDVIEGAIGSPYIVSKPSDDLHTWLAINADPRSAQSQFYLYDAKTGEFQRPLKDVAEQLRAERPMIETQQTAERVPVHYTVSDGMLQQGYVTVPVGLDVSTVPLVVVPHGGPWGRRDGTYDTLAQFLANRGYAVFEPNFRASTGFGRKYVMSANKDFGDGRVQQDIIDGMNYVLSRGIGDPERLAMVGHSFGGFSTLGALAFTPDLFKVGVAGAPPIDLAKAIKNFRDTETNSQGILRYEIFKELAVDLDDPDDVERLSANSPDRHWEKVKASLYVWAGEKDPKVNILNVRDYVLRLSEAGKKISFLSEPRAGHSPRKPLHTEAYYYLVETALATHVGGRMQSDTSDNLRRYLRKTLVIDHNGVASNAETGAQER